MSDADTLGALIILLCLAGSMFFSGSETAIMSLGEHQARKIVEERGAKAKAVSVWVQQPVRVLSTILVGNNLTNTLMGAVATAIAIRHLSGGQWGEYAVPIAVLFTTALLLVFGEILPKAFGRIYSHRLALPVLSVLDVLGKLLLPVTWFLTKLTNAILRRTSPVGNGQRVTADELDYLVRVGQREGSIPADQAALLRGIFRFEDKIVRDIMVPRDRVTAIDLEWPVARAVEVAQRSGHSRMPIYEGDLDHIKGVLHIKQLVGADPNRGEVEKRMRPPMYVSESLLIADLLQRFKEQRVHLAIVVDDGGHTVGVVTLEDVLEQIVGQIFDESDVAPSQIIDVAGVHFLDGQASLRIVEELFGVEFEEMEGVSSVGDLLTQLAGQMPIAGSVFVYEGVRFKILAANDRRVIRVSVELVEKDEEDET
jgi:putative hemolysin